MFSLFMLAHMLCYSGWLAALSENNVECDEIQTQVRGDAFKIHIYQMETINESQLTGCD